MPIPARTRMRIKIRIKTRINIKIRIVIRTPTPTLLPPSQSLSLTLVCMTYGLSVRCQPQSPKTRILNAVIAPPVLLPPPPSLTPSVKTINSPKQLARKRERETKANVAEIKNTERPRKMERGN